MDSYTNEASQVQNDRCNLFPDAHVLRKFRKLKQKLKRPHFRQGTQSGLDPEGLFTGGHFKLKAWTERRKPWVGGEYERGSFEGGMGDLPRKFF